MIDLIYLWWGLGMSMGAIAPIMLFSFAYKTFFSVALTPLFYLLVYIARERHLNPLQSLQSLQPLQSKEPYEHMQPF
jgi:uncharacterized PurR-regulated membrane protein YhhQ (DUF165 family)